MFSTILVVPPLFRSIANPCHITMTPTRITAERMKKSPIAPPMLERFGMPGNATGVALATALPPDALATGGVNPSCVAYGRYAPLVYVDHGEKFVPPPLTANACVNASNGL